MRVAYFDCSTGVSEVALLGALVSLEIDRDNLVEAIKGSVKENFNIYFQDININKCNTTRVLLDIPGVERNVPALEFIEKISGGTEILHNLKTLFKKYIEALAKILNTPPDKITMKKGEIIRTAAMAAGYFTCLKKLGVRKIVSNPLPIFIKSDYKKEDSGGPFIMEIMKGVKVKEAKRREIFNTAAGVAMLAVSVDEYGPLPEMVLEEVGYGAIETKGVIKSTLPVFIGNAENEHAEYSVEENVLVVETSIDDMNPEFFPYLIENLLALGALDVFLTPIYMKKGRPASLLTVLCRSEKLEKILGTIFRETTTLGVRIREEGRRVLERRFFSVFTPYGEVSVKAGYQDGNDDPVQVAPEFEDCKKLAVKNGVPLKEVYAAAQRAAYKILKKSAL